MAPSRRAVYAFLALCSLARTVAGTDIFKCVPEDNNHDNTGVPSPKAFKSNGSFSASIIVDDTLKSQNSCRSFLQVHGEYGSSEAVPLDLARTTDYRLLRGLGELYSATIQIIELDCSWMPSTIILENLQDNRSSKFRCTQEKSSPILKRFQRSSWRYLTVVVKTANKYLAGTNANIWISIFGRKGRSLDNSLHGDYEQGDTDTTGIRVGDIGPIYKIRIKRNDGGLFPGWTLEWVKIRESGQRTLSIATCNCDPGTGGRDFQIENECSSIRYCSSQLCETCRSCIRPTTSHFFQLVGGGYRCESCPWIENCVHTEAAHGCGTCNKCIESGTTAEYSVFWLTDDKRQCNPTCSWRKDRWCWPGECSSPNYWASSCKCEDGFRTIDATCDIDVKPELLTCKAGIEDSNSDVRNSTSVGNSSSCSTETHTFINIVAKTVSFKIDAFFEKNITSAKRTYIKKTELGIVNSRVEISKKSPTGSSYRLSTISLRGGGDCKTDINRTNPQRILNCEQNIQVNTDIKNGDWVCLLMVVSSGGYFQYQDYGKTVQGTKEFTPLEESKELCFKYDNEPPAHCSTIPSSPCHVPNPLVLSTRVTKSPKITVSISGWIDPYPEKGTTVHASGVDFYNLEVYGVKHLDPKTLTIDFTRSVFKKDRLTGNHNNVTIVLQDQPEMYVIYLEVHDIAGNVRYTRRFLLYDNTSTLECRDDTYIHVVSAFKDTNYKWQTHHGKIRLDWAQRYYNDFYIKHDYFVPIKPDTDRSVGGVYEQLNGILPVSGTESINGVTSFFYQWSLNNASKTAWSPVPEFTKQKLSLPLPLQDGETYEFWIKAEDIMLNTIVESVLVHIDRSVAEIADTWLVRDGAGQLFVHNNTDLSRMILEFRAFDVHSGITSVQWSLGTSDAASDIGSGALPVRKLAEGEDCQSKENCYCPAVGPCEFQNYTLTLNSLVANKTNTGQHNREYYFTLYITNGAMLKSFDHLDILVDESRPEVGVVQEGVIGSPDIDYTSEDYVLISWQGFIDHESGVKEYVVALAETCLSIKELTEGNLSELLTKTKHESTKFIFPKEGKYFTSILALNNALEPSDVACSDGIVFDKTPPVIRNIQLHQAAIRRSLHCIDGNIWLINKNLTMVELHQTPTCLDKCKSYSANNNLRLKVMPGSYIDWETSESFCRDLAFLNDTIINIPTQKVLLNWTISENNSQIRDSYIGFGRDPSRAQYPDLNEYDPTHGKTEYRFYRTGFGGSTEFFIFLKVENKAGVSSTATLGPVLIDDTPPLVTDVLKPVVVGDHVRVAWMEGTFTDPEQSNDLFTVTYRALMNGKYVSPILQTSPKSKQPCFDDGFSDCVQYPLYKLQLQDSELGKACSFELYVYNSAGHFTTVQTQTILLPSLFPPGAATVLDLDPASVDNLVDVDYHRSNTACVHWYGFHHSQNVSLKVGIGSQKGLDDVYPFTLILDLDSAPHCVSTTSLHPFTWYCITIQASCSGGTSVSSSDGFVIVTDVPDALLVNDGPGCKPKEKYQVDQMLFNARAGRRVNHTLANPLNEGFSYLLEAEGVSITDGLSVESNDIITPYIQHSNFSFELNFIPALPKPVFEITSAKDLNATIKIYACSKDSDFQTSKNTYEMHWQTEKPYDSFLTHYSIQLLEQTPMKPEFLTIAEASSLRAANITDFKLTSLELQSNVKYIASVSACFEHICTKPKLSDGLFIADKPTIGSLKSLVQTESESCTEILLEATELSCRLLPTMVNDNHSVQWSVLKGSSDVTPLTRWMHLDFTSNDSLKAKKCVSLPIHSYQKLYTCIRVICSSGQITKKCVELMPNPYAETNISHVLFELPSDDSRLTNVEDLLHSHHLGTNLKKLHEMDVDFVNISTLMSAVITNSAGHNITWYFMKDKAQLPTRDCDSELLCMKSKRSTNGYVRFGRVKMEDFTVYFICANVSSHNGKSGFTLCGNGFIVDNKAAIAGTVSVLNSESEFITDTSNMIITWSGFHDRLPPGGPAYLDGIKSFSLAIGDTPHGGNVLPWTVTGEMTFYRAQGLDLSHSQTVFVTVKAEDHVGHVTTSISPLLVVDLTPPQCGSIVIEGLQLHRKFLTASSMKLSLKNFHDPESSISSLRLSILTASNTDTLQKSLKPGTEFVEVKVKEGFVDGHHYQIKIQMTNKARLHSICKSRTFILDNSPPQAGLIRDGNEVDEVDHQTFTTRLDFHWMGFSDAHSGLKEYRVGLGTSQNTQDVQPYHSVGLKTSYTFYKSFIPGVKYYTFVEACNNAGLCTTVSSDGVVMDGSPPVAGRVLVGHSDTHQRYHGHRAYIYSHWVGFEDPETGIHHFECCIGRTERTCDIMNFTNTALSDSHIATGLTLPTSIPLYITVRAFNPVGLFTEVTSPGFQVDDTPPRVVDAPVFISTTLDSSKPITVQWENSLLHVAWKFEDDESPIHEHVLTFRTHHESAVSVAKIKLGPVDSHLLVLGKNNRLRNGDKYQVTVSACNRAGLCTTAYSPDILIDSTPPLVGGFKPPLTWESISANGSLSTFINLTWYGFSDPESNILYYNISIGRTYEGAELTDGIVVVNHDNGTEDQFARLSIEEPLSAGEKIILSILAVNGLQQPSSTGKVTVSVLSSHHTAGLGGTLEIQRHSCELHYCTRDCTCAIVGWKCRPPSKPLTCKDVSNSTIANVNVYPGKPQQSKQQHSISSLSCIAGHWELFGNDSVDIKRFEWSIGLKGEDVGVGIFNTSEEKIWYDVGRQKEVVHCLPYGRALENGEDYIIYVRSWYSETDFSISTSENIRVDHTPPAVRRGRVLKDSDETCEKDFDIFHVNQSTLSACWGGLFQETQTRITGYTVWAGVTRFGTDLLPRQDVGLSTNISLPVENIILGARYFVGVRAINSQNMTTTVISDGFLLDADEPIGGHVFNTRNHRDAISQADTSAIGLSWHGFQDHHSSIRKYHIEIHDVESSVDIVTLNVTLQNYLIVDNLHLEDEHSYIASVTAEDFAGHISVPVLSKPISVDTTPPSGFTCDNFEEVSYTNTSHSNESVGSMVINQFFVDFPKNEGNHFKVIFSLKNKDIENNPVHFEIGNFYAQAPLMPKQNGTLLSAQYEFTLNPEDLDNMLKIIAFERDVVIDVNISVSVCKNQTLTSGPDAITTVQVGPSQLSICARVLDAQSGLKSVQIGVGTTHDGYQVQRLQHTVARFHELFEVDLPHGTPIYTTVIAENHAGLESYFTSYPLILDHTPPSLTNLQAELRYSKTDGSDIENVTVEATWMVEDRESGIRDCWCSLGHADRSSDIVDWFSSFDNTTCKAFIPTPVDGQTVFLTIQCMNTVELKTVSSSQPLLISLNPPSTMGSRVTIISQNSFSQHEGEIVQSVTSSLKFEWTWADDRTVKHFQCRADESITADWSNSSIKYCEFPNVKLKGGNDYRAHVRAVDLRGRTSDVISAVVTVDDSTPQLTGVPANVDWNKDDAIISYGNVFHHRMEHLTYTINVGSSSGYSDYLRQYQTIKNDARVPLPASATEIYVTITATAPVGTAVTYNDTFKK